VESISAGSSASNMNDEKWASSIEPGRAASILENDEISSRQPFQWKL
jgi:hypothetical protein